MIITVLGRALAVLVCKVKPEWMTYTQQRKAFNKGMTDELKRAARFVESTKQ